MKSKKVIHHKIEQRAADRKNARKRQRHFFRLASKTDRLRADVKSLIKKTQTEAKG